MLIDFDYIRGRASNTADRWISAAGQNSAPATILAGRLTDSGFKIRDMIGHRFFGRILVDRSEEDRTLFGEILVLSLATQKASIYAHHTNLPVIPALWQKMIEWDSDYREETGTLYRAFKTISRDFGAYAPARFEVLGADETTRYMAHIEGNVDKILHDFLQEPDE